MAGPSSPDQVFAQPAPQPTKFCVVICALDGRKSPKPLRRPAVGLAVPLNGEVPDLVDGLVGGQKQFWQACSHRRFPVLTNSRTDLGYSRRYQGASELQK